MRKHLNPGTPAAAKPSICSWLSLTTPPHAIQSTRHWPRQNGGVAKISHGSLRWQLIQRNNIKDPPILEEHSRRLNSVRRHDASRKECFEAQVRSLDNFLAI